MIKRLLLTLCILLLSAVLACAHKPDEAPHQTFAMEDLQLQHGERIKDFSISYVTHGVLNSAKDNAVLLSSPFMGDHHVNDRLIGKGKAFDTDKFFVICVDAIGNGLSTSPSNSKTQPGTQFPQYSVQDMVLSQYRLITEHFGIKKLAAVAGTSMGGMQSLQWAVSYPDSVDAVVALVPVARVSPWTQTLLELQRQTITLDPVWNGGAYTTQPEQGLRLSVGMLFGALINTPQALNAQNTQGLAEARQRLSRLQDMLWDKMDANDLLSQISACSTFDLGRTPGFNGDTQKALGSIKARTLILLGENDLLLPEDLMRADAAFIPNAAVVLMKGSVPLGHFVGTGNVEMDFKQRVIADFLNEK